MPGFSIKIYPAAVLRREAKPVKNVDGRLIKTADAMIELMYENYGIGLAGPQVGVSKRVLVMDLRQDEHPAYVMINPQLKKREGEIEAEEGCLSFPEIFGEVRRAERIQVFYVDRDGEEQTLDAEGLLARAIQHEIDHLNGVLFVDRLEKSGRQLVEQQLRALSESFKGKARENAG